MLRIEELMAEQDATFPALERVTGIDRQTIWRYAKGKQSPSIERAYLLARALGVTLDELHTPDATASANGRKQLEKTPTPDLIPSGVSRANGVKAGAR